MVSMGIFSGERKSRGFLLLFGSQALGEKKVIMISCMYTMARSRCDMSLIRKYKGPVPIDEMPLKTFIEGIRIGVPRNPGNKQTGSCRVRQTKL